MTRINKYALIIFAAALLFGSCQKVDVPTPSDDEPVFYADLQIGDEMVDYAAGRDEYFMEASFHRVDQFFEFIAIMRPQGCTMERCPGSLRFRLRHVAPYDPTNFDVRKSLRMTAIPFVNRFRRDSMRVKFQSNAPDAIQKIQWSIDGERLKSDGPFVAEMATLKPYKVSIQISDRDCVSRQMQTVLLPRGGCRSKIVLRGNKELSVASTGVRPLSYNWMDMSTDSTLSIQEMTNTQLRNIWVKVTDANGCVSLSELGFKAGANREVCIADFQHRAEFLPAKDEVQRGAAVVEYIAEDGTFFSSNYLSQPSDSHFEIVSVEDFAPNDRGQKTKKLTLNLACTLYNETDSTEIDLRGRTVIAVAFPGN